MNHEKARNVTVMDDGGAMVYWHRQLPPASAEAIGEHVVEASSRRVPGTVDHGDELWNGCREDLMAQTRSRLQQEVTRLGGRYAHVIDEAIDTRRDEATGERWLHGRFTYMLYH